MVTSTKPRRIRAADIRPEWHVIDADGQTLGRISSEIAVLLMGKHRPSYVSNMLTGDFVIVINAEKVRVTGKKLEQKMYYRHSGYHGGLTERTLAQVLDKTPTRVIKHSVKGMLPKNTLGKRMLYRLKIYAGDSHPHEAQVNVRKKSEKPSPAAQAGPAEQPEPREEPTVEVVAPEINSGQQEE